MSGVTWSGLRFVPLSNRRFGSERVTGFDGSISPRPAGLSNILMPTIGPFSGGTTLMLKVKTGLFPPRRLGRSEVVANESLRLEIIRAVRTAGTHKRSARERRQIQDRGEDGDERGSSGPDDFR